MRIEKILTPLAASALFTCTAVWAIHHASAPDLPSRRLPCSPAARKIIDAARDEVRRDVRYDASYRALTYPGGDVPRDRGACTDVLVRAFRAAGRDLQKLVHEDMRARFKSYPQRYGLRAPDPNIDHRRVPNLRVFFARHAANLTTETTGKNAATWQPGDIVFWELTGGVLDHCGILTDTVGKSGLPTVVHNLGGAAEEDCLTRWRITAHVRYPGTNKR